MKKLSLALLLAVSACAHAPPPEPQKAEAPPPAAPAAPPEVDRSKVPGPMGSDKPVDLPPIETFTLPNGLTVGLVQRHKLPVIALVAMVKGAGFAADGKDLPGLASFTANMLDEGAGGRSAEKLALEIENLGANLSSSASADGAFVSATGLMRVEDPLLTLFADVLTKPNFAPDDLKRVQGEVQATILRERDSGPTMARLLFSQVLFGSHPYGHRPLGTQQSVAKFDEKLVARFHAEHFTPQATTLVVVGDVTRKDFEPKLLKALGDWKAKGGPAVALPNPPQSTAVKVAVFDKPKAAQSSVMVGLVGLQRTDPDYIPATVMNAIFGGLFNSHLNMNLREAKHWSYGARSGFDARLVPGPFVAGAEIQTDHTGEAVAEIFKEIDRMRQEKVSAEELEAAKTYLVRSLPARFETVGGTATSVADVLLYNLPLDYWDTYAEKVKAVTAEQVQQMAQKYLQADKMVVTVAGDLEKIEKPLGDLKLGALEVYDAEGKKQK